MGIELPGNFVIDLCGRGRERQVLHNHLDPDAVLPLQLSGQGGKPLAVASHQHQIVIVPGAHPRQLCADTARRSRNQGSCMGS